MTSESSIKFGGGTALVVVVSDEPMMESDLQQHTRMRHVDGRTAVLGGVSKFRGQGFQGHGYLLEFAVPDPGEYRLSLGPGIRDWFGNASSSDRDFTLRFEVTRWMTDGVYEGAPDASLQWASLFDLRFDPELGLKIFEEGLSCVSTGKTPRSKPFR